MTSAAIIVAAGSGRRFGDAGKSFALIAGKPMAWWSLTAAANAATVDELILVCGEHSRSTAGELVAQFISDKPVRVVLGGNRRQDSALAGIRATSEMVDIVAIHDAARPLVTNDLFDRVIVAAREHGAAITAIPVSDTIKHVEAQRVIRTLPRDNLVRVQTPQAFDKQRLLQAFADAEQRGVDVTDEAMLIEQSSGYVAVVSGSDTNLKVTYPGDFPIIEMLLRRKTT